MLNIAVAGAIPKEPRVIDRLTEWLGRVRGCAASGAGGPKLTFIVSPAYATPEWREWIFGAGCRVTGIDSGEDELWEDAFDRRIHVESALRETLGDMICNRADILLAVWNENVRELDGATWELLRIALSKRLPCVWISARTGKVYWQEKTVYDTCDPKRVEQIISATDDVDVEPATCERPSPLLRAGGRLYRWFLGKYRAGRRSAKAEEDALLRDDYRLGPEFSDEDACRLRLLERYRAFDRAAIECNDLYQAALYWRAVLPMITSVFVAIGFYATDVLAALPFGSMTAWEIVAGVGFLIHGFLNLYVFLLSRSAKIQACQNGMIENRQMAELLRIVIHFIPFGIYPDLRRLCGEDRRLYARIRMVIGEAESGLSHQQQIGRRHTVDAFRHAEQMLVDQIEYHTQSCERYARLVAHLERWSNAVFYAGFGFILFRAGLKFVMSFGVSFPEVTLNNGVTLRKFVSSAANMLALMVPAWYSFFTAKLSLCNFRFNRDNHRSMQALLLGERDNFEHLRCIIDDAPAEALRSMAESLAEIMAVKDTLIWVKQYRGTRISHL